MSHAPSKLHNRRAPQKCYRPYSEFKSVESEFILCAISPQRLTLNRQNNSHEELRSASQVILIRNATFKKIIWNLTK